MFLVRRVAPDTGREAGFDTGSGGGERDRLLGRLLRGRRGVAVPRTDRLDGARVGGQGGGLAGRLPGELLLAAAEVAVGRRLAVDGTQEVELADERARAAVE